MSDDNWEDRGHANHGLDIGGAILDAADGTELRNVHNKDTDEDRVVYVGENQTTGEAIEKGQFKD